MQKTERRGKSEPSLEVSIRPVQNWNGEKGGKTEEREGRNL